jgi:hypothetical protein
LGLLRDLPLWRVITWPAVGTVLGSSAGWAVARNPRVPARRRAGPSLESPGAGQFLDPEYPRHFEVRYVSRDGSGGGDSVADRGRLITFAYTTGAAATA